MLRLYLAHPILLRKEIREIEVDFETRTGIDLVNPFYDAGERTDVQMIDAGKRQPWSEALDYRGIVKRDLDSIDSCNGIVAFVDKGTPSMGTYFEIWYCFSHGKPVYVITENWGTHPWLRFVAEVSGGRIFSTFEELRNHLAPQMVRALVLKVQGQIRKFATGATRDTDVSKPDYEGFLSPLVIQRFGQFMHKHRVQPDGALRESDNWQKGIPLNEYIKSGFRHFMDWWLEHRGHDSREGLEEALCALMFNVQGYLHEVLLEQERKK